MADIDPIDSPLIISPDDIAEIIEALAENREEIIQAIDNPPVARVDLETKNRLNDMSDEYSKAQLRKYLKNTNQIRSFLAAPENQELLRLYEEATDEMELRIITNRKDYQSFDQVMDYLVDLLFRRDATLRKHKRLTRALLFYMYWNCDIGERGDDDAATD